MDPAWIEWIDLGWISLAALVVVIVVSCTSSVNPGVLSVALAAIICLYLAPLFGQTFTVKDIVAGFPADLFLKLVGVTLLFSQAQVNGTLERISRVAVGICRGNVGLIPVMFFLLTFGLASLGAGNIAGAALMAPMAMAVAGRAGIAPFLMAIMVAHGSLAGALSPIAPTGIIANKLMSDPELGLPGNAGLVYGYNLVANVVVAALGYLAFGGSKLFSRTYVETPVSSESAVQTPEGTPNLAVDPSGMQPRHWATLAIITGLIALVLFRGVDVGMGAFVGATIITLAKLSDERQAFRNMPWSVMVMVCGVTVLTALLEKTGGISRFADIISRVSTPRTVPGVIALVAGGVSVYSSSSGVVLPVFLPMTAPLVADLGGSAALKLNVALSVIVSGHLVDSSPLSTIGALCIAPAPLTEDRRLLYNKMLFWGLSMAVVGAIVCQLLFGMS